MSRRKPLPAPPTLAQHFEAPDEYVGEFGWLCGYSADADFLNSAAEYFTRQTMGQRAFVGSVSLALMLDPSNGPITFLDAPGVAHLPLRSPEARPFALLHAKVALLGFRHRVESDKWLVRLIVSTGNWTRQTIEESLDLAWCVDVRSEELSSGNDDTRLCCADIKAADALLNWLAPWFDDGLLNAGGRDHPGNGNLAKARLAGWLSQCEALTGSITPRFFDNRDQSLLEQLPARVRNGDKPVARNCLSMGSGFYESSAMPGSVPTVPREIVATLQKERLLTSEPYLDLFVNPGACQAIAQAVPALTAAGYKVRQPRCVADYFGEGAERTLHAKFLFSANYRNDSDNCSRAWLYLGSGNLTTPGFLARMSRHAGNLEAGVVFAPESLLWGESADSDPQRVISNILPVQWDDSIGESTSLCSGSDMPDRPPLYFAPPLAWLRWDDADDGNGILKAEEHIDGVEVLDSNGSPCARGSDHFVWTGARPRLVQLQWETAGEVRIAEVPVVDTYGRIAAAAQPSLDIIEAWDQLAEFPQAPEYDGDGDGDDSPGTGRRRPPGKARAAVGAYPIREMMELVERIAAKQTSISAADWTAWCWRLEQTLVAAADSPAVVAFQTLALNPLGALKAEPFRPDFAETAANEAGRHYEATLAKIESAWRVESLAPIGALQ